MDKVKFDKLAKKYYNEAYDIGYDTAKNDSWAGYNKGDFTDDTNIEFPDNPLQCEELLEWVAEWTETDYYHLSIMNEKFNSLIKYREDGDWVHLYTEIGVGFEDGYLESLLEIERV